MIKEYEISPATIAIVPIDENTSKIYEEEEEYIIRKNSNKIIEDNCKFYGSSYRGRCDGTRFLTGIKSKYPIIIEESRNIIFFPTASIRNNENIWLNLNQIESYNKNDYGSTIKFINSKSLKLDISLYSLDNQYCRANLLKAKIYDKKINNL